MARKESKVHKAASNVILVCLIAIFVISAYNVGKILYNYYKDQQTYKNITVTAGGGFSGDIDFDALREINSDVIGWIYLKDSKIDYPIVKAPNNDKYLTIKFDGEWGGCGSIFADASSEDPLNQFSTIVYGHHMKDGSMFNNLKEFKDPEYVTRHRRFELITPEQKYHLEVVAFMNPKYDSEVYTPNVRNDKRESYINMIKNKAEYTTGVPFGVDDTLVILSTCAYEYKGARYVVVGKLVPWEEK